MKYPSKVKAALNKLGIEEAEHKSFLAAHAQAFELLVLILKKDESDLRKSVFSKKNYENPNWSLRQADFNGQLRQLVELLQLLEA